MTDKQLKFNAFVDQATARFLSNLTDSMADNEYFFSTHGIKMQADDSASLIDSVSNFLGNQGKVNELRDFFSELDVELPEVFEGSLIASHFSSTPFEICDEKLACLHLKSTYLVIDKLYHSGFRIQFTPEPYKVCEELVQNIIESANGNIGGMMLEGRDEWLNFSQSLEVCIDFEFCRKLKHSLHFEIEEQE